MLASLRSIPVAILISAFGLTALSQAPKNAPDPSDLRRAAQMPSHAIPSPAIAVRPHLATTAYPQYLWPKVGAVATVYYVNANAGATDAADMAANANIQTAVNTFNADFKGVIQWVPWVTGDSTYYVEINLSADDYSGECEAIEGFQNVAAQPMSGSAACAVGTILHEMGHIIGLYHEFQRSDRNNYVTVNYNNVIKGSWGNFEILTDNVQNLGLYDYASIMQYLPYSFTRNGGPVIESIPAGIPMANAEGVPGNAVVDYSAGDKEAIERLYGAPPTQVTVTSNPVGLQVYVDGTQYKTPQVFAWTLNSTHTLSVATGVQSVSSTIEGSMDEATFYYTYGRWNDSTAQTHTITVLPGDGGADFPSTSPQVATYAANFIELVPYQATVQPSGSGTVSISPTPQTYTGVSGEYLVARQQATFTATANSGYSFYQFNNGPYWLPGGLGANPKTFYVPDTGNPINMTTYFSNMPVYLVDITPETFSSNLSVLVDGDFFYTPVNFTAAYTPPGQSTIPWTPGTQHTLSYSSPQYPYSINSRYAYTSWSDDGTATHTIPSLPAYTFSYIATVQPQFYPATNFSYPPCGGTATISPASVFNGFYPSGQVLTYTATPEPGYSWDFAGWSYDLTGTTNPAQLTATDETLVFANFNIATPPQILTLTSVSPSSAIAGGSALNVTLTGTGFSSGSFIGINNGTTTDYPPTTYVSPEELTTQIPASYIATPGAFQVYVENFPQNENYNGCADFGYQTFLVHKSNLATSTTVSSSANPSPAGSSVTFTAAVTSAEDNATGTVTFEDGTTVLGSAALNSVGVATYATSALPYGSNSIKATYSGDSNNSASTSAVLTQNISGAPATMSSPTPGSKLTGSSVTFSWTTGGGVTEYDLHVGTTGAGSTNIFGGTVTGQSKSVTGIPTTGGTLNVRLYSLIGGAWQYIDYTYTESSPSAPATMSSPTPGSTLTSSSVTFTWTTGTQVTQYDLHIGTTGVGSSNIFAGTVTGQSKSITGIPTTGGTLNVRLYSLISGAWQYIDYTYTESSPATPATMSTPAPGSMLTGSSATFTWTAGSQVTEYDLHVGTTGAGSSNIFGGTVTGQSKTITGIPTTGGTLNVRLYSLIAGAWQYIDYTYTEQ